MMSSPQFMHAVVLCNDHASETMADCWLVYVWLGLQLATIGCVTTIKGK